MATRRMSCSWCHEMNPVDVAPAFCAKCGHRADVAMSSCDCGVCRRTESPKDADGTPIAAGDLVEFETPYDGFSGGVVAELFRGMMGPMAGVKIAPGRTAGTLCRRLRKQVSQ